MKRFLFFILLSAFFSLSANAQVLVDEDFESGTLPTGWTIQTNASDGGWNFGSATDLASTYWALPDNGSLVAATNDDACDCDKSADYLILPPVDLSTASGLSLQFDMSFAGGSYQGATEQAFIEYSTDGGATWTQFMEIAGTGSVDWTTQSIDLSSITGDTAATTVLIAFRYNDNGGWLFGFAVDNVLLYMPAALDAGISLGDMPPYAVVNEDITISGSIFNNGTDVINSVEISWTDGTNTYTDQLAGLNLMPGSTMSFTHSTPFACSDYQSYTVEVTVDNPNGGTDGIMNNNSSSFTVSGLSFLPEKKVFAEEATGTWCGWCPRGAVFMEYMAENYEDTYVGIAVHNGDPMAFSEYDDGITSFPGFSGFPSVVFERDVIIDPSELEVFYDDYLNRGTAATAEVTMATLDVATKSLSIEAEATFATPFGEGDYSTIIILKEDGVTGTGSGYDQVNYYSGGSNGTMGGYENLPNPVPADQMVYEDVARDILPDFDGDTGGDVAANDVVTVSMTYDFLDNWDPREMQVAFLLTDNTHGGRALNVDAMDIDILCPDNLDLSIQINDASGSGANDGSIVIDPGIGIAPFSYVLDGVDVSSTITGLSGGSYELIVTDNAGCADTTTVNVAPVAVDEIESLQKFTLLPNPAYGQVVLDLAFDRSVDLHVEVCNLTGQIIYSRQIGQTTGGQYELKLADQAEGMYLVRLKVDEQTSTQRLILMH